MTAKKALIAVTLAAALATVVYEAHRASAARDEIRALQQQQVQLEEQIKQIADERDQARKESDAVREENRTMARARADLSKLREALARSESDSPELARLRVTNSDNQTDTLASSWAAVAKQLKQRLEETPSAKIPELQLLDAADWLELARNAKLDTEAGYRSALAEVRKRAEGHFTRSFQSALNTFMGANNGQWPADLEQLKPYFNPPVDEAILQRWAIVPKTAFPGREFAGDWVLTEKSPVDPEFDHQWTIDGPFSGGVGPYHYQPSETDAELQTLKTKLEPVLKAYSAANAGKEPHDPYQLQPYAAEPTQSRALERLIEITTTNRLAR